MKLHWLSKAMRGCHISSKQHINQENFLVSLIGLMKIYRLKARNECTLLGPCLASMSDKSTSRALTVRDSNERYHSDSQYLKFLPLSGVVQNKCNRWNVPNRKRGGKYHRFHWQVTVADGPVRRPRLWSDGVTNDSPSGILPPGQDGAKSYVPVCTGTYWYVMVHVSTSVCDSIIVRSTY